MKRFSVFQCVLSERWGAADGEGQDEREGAQESG